MGTVLLVYAVVAAMFACGWFAHKRHVKDKLVDGYEQRRKAGERWSKMVETNIAAERAAEIERRRSAHRAVNLLPSKAAHAGEAVSPLSETAA